MKVTSEKSFKTAEFYRDELQRIGKDMFLGQYNHPVFLLNKPAEEPSSGGFYARTKPGVEAEPEPSGLEALVVPVRKRKGAMDVPIIVIGRNPRADIVLNDKRVSKFHAYTFFENERVLLKDKGSTNGTFVNGLQLGSEPYPLAEGATVAFGHEDGIRGMYFTAEGFVEYLNVCSGAIPDF